MRIGKFPSKIISQMRRRHMVGAGFSILILILIACLSWSHIPLRSFESVRHGYKPSDQWVVDRNGYPLESIRVRAEKRSLDWVEWSEVSPAFQKLLVKAEDRRFFSHAGVDPLALAKALWENLLGRPRGGASTITMQLVGLLKDGPNLHRRSLEEKFEQLISAVKLDGLWSKEQIAEAYINLVPFRGELVGLRAASLGYFEKNPSGLTFEESALLIALLRSPNAPVDLVAKRACRILDSADCHSLQSLAQETISKPYRLARSRDLVPILSQQFIEENHSSQSLIQTSLDRRIQELATSILREQLRSLKSQNVTDAAALVLETRTGKVLAYVANAGAQMASAQQVDGIQTRRQAGSTLKPFVYATAFDWNLLQPSSLLEDSPADITISQGRVYHPRNYDQVFRGLVSVGDALGSSMNVPAVRALQLLGEPKVLDRLHSLGFQQLQDDDYYGPSLALGAMDVTLWELTQGYRQFAIPGSTFSEKTRQSIFNILASPEHRRFTFGMDSLLTLPFSAAVKTGTSKDMRDNWCIGWTSQYTVGVWVGNFNGEPMWNVSGMSGAGPIWRNLMLALHPNHQSTPTHYEPPAEALPQKTISRIRYPASDMLVGLDPDIPQAQQKLPIEIDNPQRDHKLYLNHRLLSPKTQETILWPLQRGKYLVELKSSAGQLIDSVHFEVR